MYHNAEDIDSNDYKLKNSSFFNSLKYSLNFSRYLWLLPLKKVSSESGYFSYDWKSKQFIISYVIVLIFYPVHILCYTLYLKNENIYTDVYKERVRYLYFFHLISECLLHMTVIKAYKNVSNIFIHMEKFDENILRNFIFNNRGTLFDWENRVKYLSTATVAAVFMFFIGKNIVYSLFYPFDDSKYQVAWSIMSLIHMYLFDLPHVINLTLVIVTVSAIKFRLNILIELVKTFKTGPYQSAFFEKIRFSYLDLVECSKWFNFAYKPYQNYCFLNIIFVLTRYTFILIEAPNKVFMYAAMISGTYYGCIYLLLTNFAVGISSKVSILINHHYNYSFSRLCL